MPRLKVVAGLYALAAVGLAVGACQQTTSGDAAKPKSSAKTYVIDSSAAIETAAGFPQWAFPGPLLKSIPGSSGKFSDVQMYDRTASVDWDPASHPPMPDVVKGRMATYACGFCHLPQGAGRSENAGLAGLSEKYIIEQVHSFKAGTRKTADRKFGAAVNMELTAAQVSDADIQAAAKYFSALKYYKHLKLIESDDVPQFSSNAFVYVFNMNGPREPLGQRIIEAPDDFELFEMRSPKMTFTAYVPKGAIAHGAALAKGNDARPACASCHGENLKGSDIGPAIAGRLPTGLFRQLYDIQAGTRTGGNAALMKPIVANLTHKEMIELAAYVASLEP